MEISKTLTRKLTLIVQSTIELAGRNILLFFLFEFGIWQTHSIWSELCSVS